MGTRQLNCALHRLAGNKANWDHDTAAYVERNQVEGKSRKEALVAPLHLVATVVVSYAFALGATALVSPRSSNQPRQRPALPTFAFSFLVALGVDYNIFLVSRIREDAGTRRPRRR